MVKDILEGEGKHLAELFWHFSEYCKVSLDGLTVVAQRDNVIVLMRMCDRLTNITLRYGETHPPGGWISRRFGVKTPTSTIVARCEIQGNTTLLTEIVCE